MWQLQRNAAKIRESHPRLPGISGARGLKQTGALCSYLFALIVTRLEIGMLPRRKRSAACLADPAEQGEPMQTQPQTELRGLEASMDLWDDAGMDLCEARIVRVAENLSLIHI